MFTVEVEKQIEIAHQLPDTPQLLTKACTNKHGHGYRIQVEAHFENLVENGMACDFTVIKDVIQQYDHKDLNDFFAPTTAEVFAKRLHGQIGEALKAYGANPAYIKIRLSETGKSWVSYDACPA